MSRQTRRTFLKQAAAAASIASSFTIAGTEKVIGNEAANELWTRVYRAPYVVPEQV